MKRFFIGIIFLVIVVTLLFADHNLHLFEQANELYEQDQYSEAIQKYEAIINTGYESWELYYNLGNAYYKNKQLGKAILNYERALRLEPENEDIKFNLELANLSVVDKINIPPEFFLFKIFFDFKNYFNLNTLSIIIITFYIIIITFIIFRILIRKKTVRRLSFIVIIFALIILIMFTTILGLRVHEYKNVKYGIILVNKVDVMSSPDENSTEVFSIHKGLKAQVQKKLNNWLQIRLSDGKVGWVKHNVLEII